MVIIIFFLKLASIFAGFILYRYSSKEFHVGAFAMVDRVEKTDAEWREELTAEQFHVCRQAGTETIHGKYNDFKG